MTPNGAIVFGLLAVAAAMAARGPGLAVVAALCLAFGLIEAPHGLAKATAWSAGIVAPLAIFMTLVWVGFIGRAPAEIAAGVPGTRAAAAIHVVTICARLFFVALVTQLVVARFAGRTPLGFIRDVSAPATVKKLLALTLSLIDTLLQAVDRSRTALVAAGIVTPRFSRRNLANGWVLVQTVWLSVITIATGRLRDKWPVEHTLARLDRALTGAGAPLTRHDLLWITGAAVTAAVVIVVVVR